MKKFILTSLVLGIVVFLFVSPTAMAQPEKLPHENPDNATGLLDKVSLLFNYGRILLLASIQNYGDAQAALDELGEIEIPEEFR